MGQLKKKTTNRRRGDAEIGGGEDTCRREWVISSSYLRVSAPPVRFSSRFDEPQGRRKDPHETPQSRFLPTPFFRLNLYGDFRLTYLRGP